MSFLANSNRIIFLNLVEVVTEMEDKYIFFIIQDRTHKSLD